MGHDVSGYQGLLRPAYAAEVAVVPSDVSEHRGRRDVLRPARRLAPHPRNLQESLAGGF